MEEEIARFLRARFPVLQDGATIEIRSFMSRGGGRHHRQFCATPEEAAAFVVSLPKNLEVYYSANPRLGEDGTKAGVITLTCIYADVDAKHFGSLEEAEAACLSLDLPPTFLVMSGHGYQPVWQFDVALGREHLARVERACRRLAFALGGMDAVQDASRILRVPFTTNNKSEPVAVTLPQEGGRTYTLGQLEGMLPELPPVAHNPREFRQNLDSDGNVSITFVRMLLGFISPLYPYAIYQTIWSAVAKYFPGDDGRDLVDEWSSEARIANGQDACPRNYPKKHESFRRTIGNVAAMGTLIHYAKLGGYVSPEPPVPLVPTVGARKQPTERQLLERLESLPSPAYDDLPHFVRGIYDYLGDLTTLIDRDFVTQMALCGLSQFFAGWRLENLGLNLWGLGVAASGGGKNVITDALKTLLLVVPRHAEFYTTGSPEGALRALEGTGKVLILYFDEFGDFLGVMLREYMHGMAGALCALHDGRMVAHRLAKFSILVNDPYVVMVATTTPGKLVARLKEEEIDGGLMSRLWITLPRTYEGRVNYKINPVALRDLSEEIGQHMLDLEGLVTEKRCRFYQEEPDELVALEAELGIGTGVWRTFEDELANPRRAQGRHIARWKVIAAQCELWKKRPEVEDGWLVITKESCALALALVRRAIVDQNRLFPLVGGSEDSKGLDRIRRAIERAGDSGLTRSALLRATKLKAADLTRLLAILEDSREIEEGIGGGGTIVYRRLGGRPQPVEGPVEEMTEDNL